MSTTNQNPEPDGTDRNLADCVRINQQMETFVRDNIMSWWHQSGTAKVGRDSLSVVDSKLKVYGIKNLRIADASIMPRLVSGNTMAPCVIIGERAASACGAVPRP